LEPPRIAILKIESGPCRNCSRFSRLSPRPSPLHAPKQSALFLLQGHGGVLDDHVTNSIQSLNSVFIHEATSGEAGELAGLGDLQLEGIAQQVKGKLESAWGKAEDVVHEANNEAEVNHESRIEVEMECSAVESKSGIVK
jgi:hypothetical protein